MMAKIITKHVTMGEYLSNGEIYNVHRYQRFFKWDFKKNALPLVKELLIKGDNFFFLGTIVLSKNDGFRNKEIVDGQQRTVATSLLLKCIYSILEKRSDNDGLEDVNKYLFANGEDAKTKLEKWNGKSIFDRILKNEFDQIESNYEDDVIKHIYDFYKTANKELRKYESEELRNLINYLLKMNLVLITTPIDIIPEEVFESINSKGLQLTINDLVKNYFYKMISSLEEKVDNKSLESKVEDIFSNVSNIANLKKSESQGDFNKIERFYQSYVNYRRSLTEKKENKNYGREVISENNTNKLYETFKEITGDLNTSNDIFKELHKLNSFQKTYKSMRNSLIELDNNIETFKAYSLLENHLLWPVIYFFSMNLNGPANLEELNIEISKEFLSFIDSFYKYYFILQIKKPTSVKNVFEIINYFENWNLKNNFNNDKGKLTNEAVNVFSNVLFNEEKSTKLLLNKYYISDDLRSSDLQSDIYNNSKLKSLFTVSQILVNNNSDEDIIKYKDFSDSRNKNLCAFTLDHIIPKSKINSENSYLEKDVDNIILSERYIHSIGNLVLVKKDDFENREIEDKIEDYLDQEYSTKISKKFANDFKNKYEMSFNKTNQLDENSYEIIEMIKKVI